MSTPDDEPTGTAGRPRRPPAERARRARRRRRAIAALKLLGVLAVFAVGVLLGDAWGDRPGDPRPVTTARDVRQVRVTETVASRTITVVVSQPAP